MKLFTCAQTGLVRDADAERRECERKQAAIKHAVVAGREAQIQRICAYYELESDEFYTAREKAVAMMNNRGRG